MHWLLLTISLPNKNIRPHLEEIRRSLRSQWCGAGEQSLHGAQIVLGAFLLGAQHVDNNWGNLGCGQRMIHKSALGKGNPYQEERRDFEMRNS